MRSCRFSKTKTTTISGVDVLDGYDFTVNCVVESYLDNRNIWSFWADETYNEVIKDLDKIPFLHSVIIQTFKADVEQLKEMERS